MKRRIILLLLAAALCMIIAPASAIELTFAQTCTEKTSRDTQLYVLIGDTDELTAAQVLPAGTYVRTNGLSVGSVIVSAAVTLTLPSGRTVTVGEALVRSRQALNLWLDMEYGETLDGETYTDANGNTHEIGNEAAEGSEEELAGDAKWSRAMSLAYAHNGSTLT